MPEAADAETHLGRYRCLLVPIPIPLHASAASTKQAAMDEVVKVKLGATLLLVGQRPVPPYFKCTLLKAAGSDQSVHTLHLMRTLGLARQDQIRANSLFSRTKAALQRTSASPETEVHFQHVAVCRADRWPSTLATALQRGKPCADERLGRHFSAC